MDYCDDPKKKYEDEIAECQEELDKVNEQIGKIEQEIIECDSIGPKHDAKKADKLQVEQRKLEDEATRLANRIRGAQEALDAAERA